MWEGRIRFTPGRGYLPQVRLCLPGIAASPWLDDGDAGFCDSAAVAELGLQALALSLLGLLVQAARRGEARARLN